MFLKKRFVLIVFISLAVKVSLYAYLRFGGVQIFGGGNDAGYYDLYAQGFAEVALNLWPILLRALAQVGWYSRDDVSLGLFVISISILPWIYSRCVRVAGSLWQAENARIAFLVVALYPTIFFFTTDIYRDVFLFLTYAVAIFYIKKYYQSTGLRAFPSLLAYVAFSIVAFGLRDYLGVALLVSMPITWLLCRIKVDSKGLVLVYFATVVAAKFLGFFDPLINYRGEEGFSEGGATLGIGLVEQGLAGFTALFLVSFSAQVFGLFFSGAATIIAFLVESVPFLFALRYVLKNFDAADRFCRYLFVFAVVYSTIWVIGNDNLGTAARLRVPTYLSIFAICLRIRSLKGARLQY